MVFTGVLSDEWTSEKRKVDSSILSLTTNLVSPGKTSLPSPLERTFDCSATPYSNVVVVCLESCRPTAVHEPTCSPCGPSGPRANERAPEPFPRGSGGFGVPRV